MADLGSWIQSHAAGGPYGCLIHRGAETHAWYGGGFTPVSRFEIGSVRKSFNSALAGIAMARGALALDLKAAEVWPELVRLSGDARDREITLHQLLSGTSGWLTADAPGAAFRYNNAAFTAAEQVVARLLELPGAAIAPEVERRFKGALGTASWRIYHFSRAFAPDDIENPGPKLAIDSTLEDLVTWGRLWLGGGSWRGEQLIPQAWVRRATSWANPGMAGPPYGYNWFVNARRRLWPAAPEDSYGHAGFGTFTGSGEASRAYLWVCPGLHVVAGIVADVTAGFASDFLDVPNRLTAEWVGRVMDVCGSQREALAAG